MPWLLAPASAVVAQSIAGIGRSRESAYAAPGVGVSQGRGVSTGSGTPIRRLLSRGKTSPLHTILHSPRSFTSVFAVVLGTTVGMMAANVPAVLLSHAIASTLSLKIVRATSGILCAFL